jgi:chloramphenicol O-acetyltransferase
MESVEEFHYKLREDGLYYYDELVPLFTDYEDDNDLFITGTELKKDESMIDFCKSVKKNG